MYRPAWQHIVISGTKLSVTHSNTHEKKTNLRNANMCVTKIFSALICWRPSVFRS